MIVFTANKMVEISIADLLWQLHGFQLTTKLTQVSKMKYYSYNNLHLNSSEIFIFK